MKKIFSLLLVLSSLFASAQLSHIPIFLGVKEPLVTNYLDSIIQLKSNPAVKIVKDVSSAGDLWLNVDFPMNDEAYYSCLTIHVGFQRASNGSEFCVRQIISGRSSMAYSNVSFVKDNFKEVSFGRWEKPDWLGSNIKAIATLEITKGDYPYYILDYSLRYPDK